MAMARPDSVTVSGDREALDELVAALTARQVFCRVLPLDYAFHSPHMDVIRDGVRYMVDQAGQDTSGAIDAWQGAMAFIQDVIIAPLRENPGDDLLSHLLAKQPEVAELTDDVIAAIGFSIIGAGFDTT